MNASTIVNNTITNDWPRRNVSGNVTGGYQAGIVGYGKGDNIVNNKISGRGYEQGNAPTQPRSSASSTSTLKERAFQ